MNNLLRKITAGLLSATMILSGLGSFPMTMSDLFAYAKDDPPAQPDVTAHAVDVSVEGRSGAAIDTDSKEWYVLDLSTGRQPGDCLKSIIINYTDNVWNNISSKTVTRSHSQVLNPADTYYPEAYKKDFTLGSDKIKVLDPAVGEGAEFIPYSGSRYASFSTAITAGGDSIFSAPLKAGIEGRGDYVSMSQELEKEFKPVSDMITDVPFVSESTDQIVFKTEYPIDSLDSISFYCESTGNDSWDLNGWTLYKVTSLNGNYPDMKMTSGTFITDKLTLDFDGAVVAESNSANLKEGLAFVNAGMFTFYSENNNPTFDAGDNPYTFTTKRAGGYSSSSPTSQSYTPGAEKKAGDATVLNFSVNIMDSYGAGIDCFNMTPDFPMNLKEMLTARIYYNDTSGVEKSIGLPVFSNAILDFTTDNNGESILRRTRKLANTSANPIENVETADGNGANVLNTKLNNYLSFAQQGESIVFSVALNDFASLNKISLNYANPVDENDSLIIKDITVYDNWGVKGDALRNNYTLKDLDANSEPVTVNVGIGNGAKLLYKTASVTGGVVLDGVNSNETMDFYDPDSPKVKEPVKDYSKLYLVQIHTSDVNFADTTDDVMVSFSYLDRSGKSLQTQEYSLLERCQDFYGYNPGVDGNGKLVDGNYVYGMRRGGTLKFFIEVQNLDHLTGMTVRLGENCKDDWQMSSVDISPVNAMGQRTVTPHLGTYSDVTITRVYDRDIPVNPIYSSDTRIYIQEGVTETVDLESGHSTTETERRDMSEYYYEMDYKTATSELHFDERAWKYQVSVNVQKNSVSGTTEDDCGSNNLFYFQLVFEKGKSAYVLANQQLKHDCFRAGQTETFNVAINENLGELVSINIIPDDTTAEATRLDKLCIDSIEVIKSNPDTANKRYVCENIGWINAEYEDTAEKSTREGRNEAELVTSVPVDYSGYMVALEVAVGIDSYTGSNKNTGEQFVGGMTVNVKYETTSGEMKTTGDLDMVQLMYEYAGRMGAADEIYTTVSDPNFMFRPNKINRFIVDVSDIKRIDTISFNGMSQTECQLPIAAISVRLLMSDGTLIINDEGEFQRIYTIDPILLTDQIPGKNFPYNCKFVAGHYTPYTFRFGENTVPELDPEESSNTVVTREPLSCNDTLNVYVYMKEGVPAPDAADYNVKARISYSSVSTTNTFVNECSKLKTKREGDRVVLYAKGLSANNISILTNLKLSAEDLTSDKKYSKNPGFSSGIDVDYVIVQQVRNGVTINTYKILYNYSDVFSVGGISMATKSLADTMGYGQKVTLRLGKGTLLAKLVPEEYDIALAIKYKSAAAGEDDKSEYKSAYAFATDMDITTIQEGSIIEFNFNEALIDEITGVEVIAMNGLDVTVDAGNIVCTSRDDATGEIITDGWYSMGEETEIKKTATNLPITSTSADDYNSLKRVKFTFATMEKSNVIDSGGNAPIKMIIAYRSTLDENEQYVIDDIRKCSFGSFAAGEEATADIFVTGLKSLNYIVLVPYDDDPSTVASWNLESVSFKMEGGADSSEHNIPVGRTLYEREDTLKEDGDISNYVNVSTMAVSLNRKVGEDGAFENNKNAEQEISIAPGTSLTFILSIENGNSDYYAYSMNRVTGGVVEQVVPYTETANTVNLDFENSETETQAYRITIFAVENPTARITLTVNVAPEKIEDVPVVPPVVPNSENNGTGGEQGGNTDVDVPNPNTQGGTGNTTQGGTENTTSGGSENTTQGGTGNTTENQQTGGNVGSADKKTTKKREEETSLDA